MVNKAKKRSLSQGNVSEKPAVKQDNAANKKKKVENKAGVQNGQPKQSPNKESPVAAQNKVNKNKQNKEAAQNVQAPQQSPQNQNKQNKKKEKNVEEALKAKQAYRQKRKEERKTSGSYVLKSELTLEQIKARIEEITKRETLSKTAKRKLGVLRKRQRVLESGESEVQKDNVEKVEKAVDNKNKQPQKADAAKNKKGDAKAANKKGNQGNLLLVKQDKKEEEDDDEDDEEEEDVDDEEESDDDLEEEEEEVDNEEEEDDDDDDDGEDEEDDDEDDEDDDGEEEDEEEKTTKKVDAKTKQTPKTGNSKQAKDASADQTPGKDHKVRYVLFVSNLPYSATVDEIKKHFLTKVSDVTSVRIPLKRDTNTPRGFAYVEFPNSTEYEKGLSLHGTFLKERRISVQYSASGKNAGNKQQIVAKNHKLHAMRKQGKLAGSQNNQKNQKFGGKKGKPTKT